MKAYLITTGTVFGLITAARIWRVAVAGMPPAKDPVFIALTAASAGLCLWACRLLKPGSPHE
jgi:hypothetical protein